MPKHTVKERSIGKSAGQPGSLHAVAINAPIKVIKRTRVITSVATPKVRRAETSTAVKKTMKRT